MSTFGKAKRPTSAKDPPKPKVIQKVVKTSQAKLFMDYQRKAAHKIDHVPNGCINPSPSKKRTLPFSHIDNLDLIADEYKMKERMKLREDPPTHLVKPPIDTAALERVKEAEAQRLKEMREKG